MTPELEALGRRAVACPGWKWMPGMLANDGTRLLHEVRNGWIVYDDDDQESGYLDGVGLERRVPEFSDPATLGCLLALVREAWKAPRLQVSPLLEHGLEFVVYPNMDGHAGYPREIFGGRSAHPEAAALVVALERAP